MPTTTFPDGTTWSLTNSTTITSEGPRGDFSWTFDSELQATVAWMEVCMK